ncbi:MAG: hypothetical protein V3W44_08735, partial [Dehalococcoidales bacterium]
MTTQTEPLSGDELSDCLLYDAVARKGQVDPTYEDCPFPSNLVDRLFDTIRELQATLSAQAKKIEKLEADLRSWEENGPEGLLRINKCYEIEVVDLKAECDRL